MKKGLMWLVISMSFLAVTLLTLGYLVVKNGEAYISQKLGQSFNVDSIFLRLIPNGFQIEAKNLSLGSRQEGFYFRSQSGKFNLDWNLKLLANPEFNDSELELDTRKFKKNSNATPKPLPKFEQSAFFNNISVFLTIL